jgi:hypothetical protein
MAIATNNNNISNAMERIRSNREKEVTIQNERFSRIEINFETINTMKQHKFLIKLRNKIMEKNTKIPRKQNSQTNQLILTNKLDNELSE